LGSGLAEGEGRWKSVLGFTILFVKLTVFVNPDSRTSPKDFKRVVRSSSTFPAIFSVLQLKGAGPLQANDTHICHAATYEHVQQPLTDSGMLPEQQR
jgi:hypothetical protein